MHKLYHVARILAAVILLQTLYFKFTAHPESVELFTKIGMEPDGRITTGIIELITGLLLLFGGQYVWLGAVLGIALMGGALYYHLTVIGINQLFWMAVITLASCLHVLWWSKKESEIHATTDGGIEDQ